MKRLLSFLLILLALSPLFAQEAAETVTPEETNIIVDVPATPAETAPSNGMEQHEKTKKNPFSFLTTFIKPDFAISFNEGISYGQITRIEKMENRSNFVRENFLIGAFVNAKTDNLSPIDAVLQISAYYPYYQAFNGMRQYPKNVISYAFDGYLGAVYSFDQLRYVLFDVSIGMHYMYQLTDEYHMNYLGLGTLNTIELPITKNWSVINNYFFSFDNANLGSNKKVQKFDASYQYHIDLGVRYSRKALNSYYYIDVDKIKANRQAKKAAKININ